MSCDQLICDGVVTCAGFRPAFARRKLADSLVNSLREWTGGFDKIPHCTELLPFTAGDLFSVGSKFWRGKEVETGEEIVRVICDERKSAQQKGTICKTVVRATMSWLSRAGGSRGQGAVLLYGGEHETDMEVFELLWR